MERSKLLRVLFVALGVVGVLAIAAGIFVVSLLREDMSKVELRFRLEPGRVYALHREQVTQISGEGLDGTISVVFDYAFDVQEIDAEGNAKIDVTCDRLQVKQSGAGGDVNYDSSSSNEAPPGVRSQGALLAQDFSMTLSPKGWVLALEGVKGLSQEDMDMAGLPPEVAESMAAELSKLSTGAVKMMLESSVAVYPEGPVGPGDTWERRLELAGASGQIPLETFEFKRHKKGLAVIAVRSEAAEQANLPGPQGMKGESAVSAEGTIEVDKATGHICRAEIRGEVSISAQTPAGRSSVSIQSVERRSLLPKE